MNVEAARKACVKVFTVGPITDQLLYQSGRLVDKTTDSGAVAYLRQAIDEFEYPIAYYHLGLLYEDGLYIKKSLTKAQDLFKQGYKRDSLVSGIALARVSGELADINAYAVLGYLNTIKDLSIEGHKPSRKQLDNLRADGYVSQHNKLFPHNKFEYSFKNSVLNKEVHLIISELNSRILSQSTLKIDLQNVLQ